MENKTFDKLFQFLPNAVEWYKKVVSNGLNVETQHSNDRMTSRMDGLVPTLVFLTRTIYLGQKTRK